MQRSVFVTEDGSHSIEIPAWRVTYHSRHGAIQESQHVFIEAGLRSIPVAPSPLRIFEMGFGTGLNALLTLMESERRKQAVHYEAIDLYPLEADQAVQLNYCDRLGEPGLQPFFSKLHQCEWEKEQMITPFFTLHKVETDLKDFTPLNSFDLIYYDAFAPGAQPELWKEDIFKKLSLMLKPGGKLVTYCAKGEVRRNMIASGLIVEKLPGPKGKREMLRALRPEEAKA